MRGFLASRKPSPAMAVAFVALLAALSGTAIALPGSNTVNSGDIKNNTIRSKDIRNGTVAGRDVKNGSVKSADVGNDSLTGTDINESTLGQVPSADTANSAATANALGGTPASQYKTSAVGVVSQFMVDGTQLENGFGQLPTLDNDGDGTDTFTFPFNINDEKHNIVVSGGGAGATGGVLQHCFLWADPVDDDTIDVKSVTYADAPCNEEYTVTVFG
jgi:hypothetical protein